MPLKVYQCWHPYPHRLLAVPPPPLPFFSFLCEEPPLGTLADFLQPAPGGPAARFASPPLTAAERVGLAMGAARGLAFLHGVSLREAAASSAPLLHLQLSPAYLGIFSRDAAKLVLGPAFIAQGEEIEGGFRYCGARDGAAGVAEEVHALGVLLCELLTGRLFSGEGDLRAARTELEPCCGGASGGGASAPADACWEACAPAAATLARLALRCTDPAPARRPGSARDVALALEALLPAVTASPRTGACGTCAEAYAESQGLRCVGGGHFTCADCLSDQVEKMDSTTTPAELKAAAGGLRCLGIVEEGGAGGRVAPCRALWAQDAIIPVLRPEAVVVLLRATTFAYLTAVQREERGVARVSTSKSRVASLCKAWAGAPEGAAARDDALAALSAYAVEEAMYMRCPNCGTIQELTSACPSVTCGVNEDGTFHREKGCGFDYILGTYDWDRCARLAHALRPVAPPQLRLAVLHSLRNIIQLHGFTTAAVLRAIEVAEEEEVKQAAAAAGSRDHSGAETSLTRGEVSGNEAATRDALDQMACTANWVGVLALLDKRPDLINAAKLPMPFALPMRTFEPTQQDAGLTPLHYAVKENNLAMAKELCRRGASPTQPRFAARGRGAWGLAWRPPPSAASTRGDTQGIVPKGKGLFVGCRVIATDDPSLAQYGLNAGQICTILRTSDDGRTVKSNFGTPSLMYINIHSATTIALSTSAWLQTSFFQRVDAQPGVKKNGVEPLDADLMALYKATLAPSTGRNATPAVAAGGGSGGGGGGGSSSGSSSSSSSGSSSGNSGPCLVCGCASEVDDDRDRLCFCDTCAKTGCGAAASYDEAVLNAAFHAGAALGPSIWVLTDNPTPLDMARAMSRDPQIPSDSPLFSVLLAYCNTPVARSRGALPPAEVALLDAFFDACSGGAWPRVLQLLRVRPDLATVTRLPLDPSTVAGTPGAS